MLDVTRLRVLAAVSRYGSVTTAARALGYAQASVSHHLARLEAETGCQLTQRVGRGIRLTEAGQMLAQRAEEILGRLDVAEVDLAAYTGLRAGRVRLAAFPSALGTFVPAAAAAYLTAHPGVEVRFTEAEPPDAIRLLRTGQVDVAVVFSYPDAPPGDGLRHTPLLTEDIFLVTPTGMTGDQLSDHARQRWIGGCERCRDHLLRLCATAGFQPEIAFTTDDYVAAQSLVAAGLGVTTLPALALAAQRHDGVRTVQIPTAQRRVDAVVYGEPPDPPATAALLTQLTRAAATHRPMNLIGRKAVHRP
ncbi:LysR family transcriptional regulator [Micromonospora polyrhachis]|uniref:DNA-binding transcriptional LysR family regulator n=1 Tax=Micromonospora polyrhachis TaxID=1282883 RepID=A0A7W7SMA0_9ACTN|nr:LysR family transcriptional regulator [Micromonospora polyrhachis]MBB4957398.1 DNA-binding transcriptional LysR family regulator [Micromonospora polyrhachis]